MPYTPRHWQMFLAGSGSKPPAQPVDRGDAAKINENLRALYEQLREMTPTRTTASWLALCAELDIPATPIYRLEDLPRHPQLAAVGLFEKVEHPTEGTICQVRPTTLFGATPLAIRRHAPQLGQHTAEVLDALREA
ncbi:MAG: CoA transferase [Burkholderiaceae bacterium]|nr:CoA transferase [Burkholderiaceae bacterium]